MSQPFESRSAKRARISNNFNIVRNVLSQLRTLGGTTFENVCHWIPVVAVQRFDLPIVSFETLLAKHSQELDLQVTHRNHQLFFCIGHGLQQCNARSDVLPSFFVERMNACGYPLSSIPPQPVFSLPSSLQDTNFNNWYGGNLTAWPIEMVSPGIAFRTWTLSWLFCALISEAVHGPADGRFPFVAGFIIALNLAQIWIQCVEAVHDALNLPRFQHVDPNPPNLHWEAEVQEAIMDEAFRSPQQTNVSALVQLFLAIDPFIDHRALWTSNGFA